MTNAISFRIENALPSLEQVAEHVEAFCSENGFTPKDTYHIRLVLDELLTNVIQYGYTDNVVHFILVNLASDGEVLTVHIEDDAARFNLLEVPEPDVHAPIEDRPIGGLGIHLVQKLMNSIRYERIGNKNRITLKKRICSTETGGKCDGSCCERCE
ncbi:ATP-binding protein [Desulfovibrio inopinatus]|uniref:ATP-binding protein n=1 Tax=Desulfovibrio inopinatus TaxID=102109 RepID=UPI000412FBD9|nr:ATP-binding protein [Desulfovibrio inopinatus]